MTSLEGLHLADEINEGIFLIGNIKLTDIKPLQNIRFVGKALRISQNHELASLEGLQNLVKVDLDLLEPIVITENLILEDYCSMLPLLKANPDVLLEVEKNAYNPTAQDILEGTCSI